MIPQIEGDSSGLQSKPGPVLVAGGAHGIGACTSRHLAARGRLVIIADVDVSAAADLAAKIEDQGGHAIAIGCDIRSEADIAAAFDAGEIIAGQATESVVVSSGVVVEVEFLDHTSDAWRRVIDINLTGTFLVIREAARRMRDAENRGAIVAISSIAGRGGRPTQSAYAASKAGVISIVRSAALAVAPFGIRVNAVCPGVIDTDMTRRIHADRGALLNRTADESLRAMVESIPLARVGTQQEVANTIAFLLSSEASYITGQSLNVSGGIALD